MMLEWVPLFQSEVRTLQSRPIRIPMAQFVSDVLLLPSIKPAARVHVRNELEVRTSRLCPP
jgi:hypothetical protein